MKAKAKKTLEAAKQQAAAALTASRRIADIGDIENAQDAEMAGEILVEVTKARKDIDKARLEATEPSREETDEINNGFNELLGPLKGSEKALKDQLVEHQEREEKKAAEEAKRLADEVARKQAEEDIKAHEDEREPEIIETPKAEKPGPIRAGQSGSISIPTTWDVEIVDEDAIPRKYLLGPDLVKLRGLARSLKGDFDVPGVRAVKKRGGSVRT